MKNNKIDEFICTKPTKIMIRPKESGLDIKYWHSEKSLTRFLSMAKKSELIDLMKKHSVEFLSKIIDWHLEGEQIITFTKGGAYLLPKNYQRFYDECVVISTDNYELYINDKAIEKCSNIIFKLSERSKKDCFNFVKAKLESGIAKHLYISLAPWKDEVGRSAWFEDADQDFVSGFFPNNTVGYCSYPKEDGAYDEDDINNILNLIEEFTKARGLFKYGESDGTALVMCNKGSMKIQNYNVDQRIHEKVMMLMKKER